MTWLNLLRSKNLNTVHKKVIVIRGETILRGGWRIWLLCALMGWCSTDELAEAQKEARRGGPNSNAGCTMKCNLIVDQGQLRYRREA